MTDMNRTVGDILDGLPGGVGHNNPPEPTPFELTREEIDSLYDEAKLWLDGDPIANEGQAAEIAELRKRIQKAVKDGEARRVAEAKPFDEAKKKVQDAYNPLIHKEKGKAARALEALNTALAPYLKKIDDEQRARAAESARQAAETARLAREAAQAAAQSANLAEREEADRLIGLAKEQDKTARADEKAKPQVLATGGGRRIGMKTVYEAELVDPAAAIAHYRQAQPAALKAWMLEQAAKDIHAGPKPPAAIPGFKINSRVVPV